MGAKAGGMERGAALVLAQLIAATTGLETGVAQDADGRWVAARFSGPGQPYEGLATNVNGHARWTNKVIVVEKHMLDPLRWQTPRRIFVNSMSDLFHESLTVGQIARVWAVMALAPRHTFQILTKRPERIAPVLTHPDFFPLVRGHMDQIRGERHTDRAIQHIHIHDPAINPLPNVWVGASVEDQAAAVKRIPHLLSAPAALRFLSCEPLIGPVYLDSIARTMERAVFPGELYPGPGTPGCLNALSGEWWPALGNPDQEHHQRVRGLNRIDWVIDGGESGPNHRPADPAWFRSLRDQCAAADVPYFHKQAGGITPKANGKLLDGVEHCAFPDEVVA